MDVMWIAAVVVIVLALLAFSGIVEALRAFAWPILGIGIVVLVLAFVF